MTKGGYRTKKEAEAALAEVVAQYQKGDARALDRPDQTATGDYLRAWLDRRRRVPADQRSSLKPSTVAQYGDAINAWIAPLETDSERPRPLPYIGAVPLAQLSVGHIEALYDRLRTAGKRCRRCDGVGSVDWGRRGKACTACDGAGGRPLSSRSVQLAHVVLRMALADAVTRGDIHANPLDRLPDRERPTHTPRKVEGRHWTVEEAGRFIEATTDDRLGPLWALALDTGARRGELAGLRWADVELDQGAVTFTTNRTQVAGRVVEGSLKTASGGRPTSRTVHLSAATVARLRTWRSRQAEEQLRAGSAWEGSDGYVWTDEFGRPLRPDYIGRAFKRAATAVDGVPVIALHGLRHTSATIALAGGAPVHVVADRLGHADVKITLDTYSHVLDEQRGEAADVIGAALYGEAAR